MVTSTREELWDELRALAVPPVNAPPRHNKRKRTKVWLTSEHGCRRKTRYSSRKVAVRAAHKVIQAQGGRGTGERRMTPYRCNQCGQWHITSRSPIS